MKAVRSKEFQKELGARTDMKKTVGKLTPSAERTRQKSFCLRERGSERIESLTKMTRTTSESLRRVFRQDRTGQV